MTRMQELAEQLAGKAHDQATEAKRLFPPRIHTLADQPIETSAEYETRLKALTSAIEAMGYEAVVQVTPEHMRAKDGLTMTELHREVLTVSAGENGAGVIQVMTIRYGRDVGGLRAAELWLSELRDEHAEKLGDQARAQADAERAADAAKEAFASRPVSRAEFNDLLGKFGVVSAQLAAITEMLKERPVPAGNQVSRGIPDGGQFGIES